MNSVGAWSVLEPGAPLPSHNLISALQLPLDGSLQTGLSVHGGTSNHCPAATLAWPKTSVRKEDEAR
jgi:hypothetical protein